MTKIVLLFLLTNSPLFNALAEDDEFFDGFHQPAMETDYSSADYSSADYSSSFDQDYHHEYQDEVQTGQAAAEYDSYHDDEFDQRDYDFDQAQQMPSWGDTDYDSY